MSESNRKRLFELLKIEGNQRCADCLDEGPEWGSYTLGVFLCTHCASIHRKMGIEISRIKSLKLDNWDSSHVKTMEEHGNLLSNAYYEKHVPLYYRKPNSNDPHVLREQWIRAKYERREFVAEPMTSYADDYLEGYLYKRGKEDRKFLLRKFVLSSVEGTLKYFTKETNKNPKAIIKVVSANITFCTNKINNPNALQISWNKDGFTRSIFVYSDSGKEIIDWYMAFRATKLRHLQIAFPEVPANELALCLSKDFLKEGFLWKTGPRSTDSYRKRWFILDENRKLMYLEHPLEAFPKGEIFLGETNEGYSVQTGIVGEMKDFEQGHSFTLITPGRNWCLGAETIDEMQQWIQALESVINKRSSIPNDAIKESTRSDLRDSYIKRSK
ncbi:arf-GAP with dual PH domain-containing 2-like protein [Sarcoptes scabiei]|uniref:Arf-GAP with dual PH domain-containing 2-like protein n=1 Tax=Sarcoptes scabiei TaxID=52283 RepID=A0A132A841_SARSC|nr:arf-GAP with dual PH domain-containing 2-like protein [Sarcoptes scabiei]